MYYQAYYLNHQIHFRITQTLIVPSNYLHMFDYLNTLPFAKQLNFSYQLWSHLYKTLSPNPRNCYQLPFFNQHHLWSPMGNPNSFQSEWLNLYSLQNIKSFADQTYLTYPKQIILVYYDPKTIRNHLKKLATLITLCEEAFNLNCFFKNTYFCQLNPLLTHYAETIKTSNLYQTTAPYFTAEKICNFLLALS